jgi:hypothetical protein
MSAHTPGPWHIWSIGSVDMYIGPPQDIDSPAVAIVPLRVSTRAAQVPNARLIAAAPEMLAALEHAREWLQGSEPHRATYISEIIAKAKGQA